MGELQFEVIQFRLLNEYGAACSFEPLNYHKACWITSENEEEIEKFVDRYNRFITTDKDNRYVFMAESAWSLKDKMESFPEIEFHFTSEFKTDQEYIKECSNLVNSLFFYFRPIIFLKGYFSKKSKTLGFIITLEKLTRSEGFIYISESQTPICPVMTI